MKIQDIVKAIQTGKIRISDHARDEAREDSLLLNEIFFSVCNGEIIEDYPKDKPLSQLSDLWFHRKRKTCSQCVGLQSGETESCSDYGL